MIVPQPKRFRTVEAPPAVGKGVINRFTTVVVAEDEDVEWAWTHTPGGARFPTVATSSPPQQSTAQEWPAQDQ